MPLAIFSANRFYIYSTTSPLDASTTLTILTIGVNKSVGEGGDGKPSKAVSADTIPTVDLLLEPFDRPEIRPSSVTK